MGQCPLLVDDDRLLSNRGLLCDAIAWWWDGCDGDDACEWDLPQLNIFEKSDDQPSTVFADQIQNPEVIPEEKKLNDYLKYL